MDSDSINLEQSLLSNQQQGVNNVRSLRKKRIALGRALTHEKNANRFLKQQISLMNSRVLSLEKKRRQSLLIGVKFRQMLDNVIVANNMNSFLEEENNKRQNKERIESFRRREHCLMKKINNVEMREINKLISSQRLEKIKVKKRRDSASLCEEIERIRQNSLESKKQMHQRIRNDHKRLRDKMKRIEEFKQAQAQKNFTQKLNLLTLRQTMKLQTLQQLKRQQKQLQNTFQTHGKTFQKMINTSRDSYKPMFPTAVFIQNSK